MNWNKFGLFKLPNRHKRFEYIPRYYNEQKETLQQKIDLAKKQNLVTEDGSYIRGIKFRAKIADKWGNSDYKKQTRKSNVRLIIILGIIIVVFYYVFIGLDGLGLFIDENLDKLN